MNENSAKNESKKASFQSKRVTTAFVLIILVLPTLFSLFASHHWAFDLLTSFHMQYAVALLPVASLFLLKKRWRSGLVLLVALVYNLGLILPVYLPNAHRPISEQSIRLMVTNVWSANREHDRLLRFIQEESPDLILALEVNAAWASVLDELNDEYPHQKSFARADNFGIALISRKPFRKAEILSLGDRQLPSVYAEIAFEDGVIVSMLGTHPLPPVGRSAAMRNQQLKDVAEFADRLDGHVILCGDLNVTPWSPYWNQLVKGSKLRDSRQGFGLQPTFPATLPWLRIPIDHVLVSDKISVEDRRVGPQIGSDHRFGTTRKLSC